MKQDLINSDAVIDVNWSDDHKKVALNVSGSRSMNFEGYMTTEGDKNSEGKLIGNGLNYEGIGEFKIQSDMIVFESPKGSVTTFFSK